MRPNNSFKPTPHRGVNSVLYATLHAVATPPWGGLTLALGCSDRCAAALHIKQEIDLTYTDREAHHFYWHCCTTAILLDNLPQNTATQAHVNNAVRMATLNAKGKNGISLASASASALLAERQGKKTEGLIREHVVPVSVIVAQVKVAWSSGAKRTWRELIPHLKPHDLDNWAVVDTDLFLDSAPPFSAVVAALVRENTVLAWVTPEDNVRLSERGLRKSMPKHLPFSPHARYEACEIELVDLS